MTADEFKAWREHAGFASWADAAKALDISVDACKSYSSGRRDIPGHIALACKAVYHRLHAVRDPWESGA